MTFFSRQGWQVQFCEADLKDATAADVHIHRPLNPVTGTVVARQALVTHADVIPKKKKITS